jgi:hypothetical protein
MTRILLTRDREAEKRRRVPAIHGSHHLPG